MQTRLYVVLFVGGSRIDDPLSFFFILFYSISFAIPKYDNYNNYNYYHKAYMHKLTTHLSTRAIPQLHTR